GPVADGSGLVPHVGGGAVVGSRRGRRPSLTVTGAYLVPFETPPATVRARTTITALRAVAALEVWRTAGFALDLGAGGGIDVLEIDGTFGEKTTGILARSSTRADPILTALATGYVALTPGVALTFVAGAEWDVTPREYLVTGPGSGDQLALLAPWRVRPVALAGFTFTALGGGLFPGRSP
ncbi:MAG TPA: hypothetical protein VH044_06390, partial [Polyangiaceae bacterium]|nr:hypothetical protein [Polyangiaceae bacterium]